MRTSSLGSEKYISVPPQSRLKVIKKRLDALESGPTYLITIVSAVEALVRSMLVNNQAKSANEIASRYTKYIYKNPDEMVEEILTINGHSKPEKYFSGDTWRLFCYAIKYRNLVVHECTYLGQDKYPALVDAAREILDELIKIGGLK
jgi:hypothetical protein